MYKSMPLKHTSVFGTLCVSFEVICLQTLHLLSKSKFLFYFFGTTPPRAHNRKIFRPSRTFQEVHKEHIL